MPLPQIPTWTVRKPTAASPGTLLVYPPTLIGYPIVVTDDMPSPATSPRSIVFGDCSLYRYPIRWATDRRARKRRQH